MYGHPDFVFPNKRLAVFVDGCFWHQCPIHGEIPISNRVFWRKKLSRNSARDRHVTRVLQRQGWSILRIWQHELGEPGKLALRVERSLRAALARLQRGGRPAVHRPAPSR